MSTCDLTNKTCKPCEGGVTPIKKTIAEKMMHQLNNWQLDSAGAWISKRFTFTDFYRTIEFINAIAFIANKEGHHPNIEASYDFCLVSFQTHAISGLSENDFICAAKIDELMQQDVTC